jgi:hypothetical protein
MAKDTHPDPESETVKVLLDLLRRVDKEVRATAELSPDALKAVERYKQISQELALGRLQQHTDHYPVHETWSPRSATNTK